MQELTDFAQSCQARNTVDAIVLAGGPDHFSAGADLKDPDRWNATVKPLGEQRRIANAGYRMCAAWEQIPQLTIAAIEGYAIGGGMALALACDLRVAADNAFVSADARYLEPVSPALPDRSAWNISDTSNSTSI